ncbi:MAG: orotidine-5'-phosphate decarboxylase [Propionibacteriaceae bacterium]|jgi:orotidine-5'-phosphate decarboxylase|nr:orotidine-5'-phosphate decarboxylase [Propionibacteriaceae bacterium]
MTHFYEKLKQRVAEFGPLCVGIDPHPSVLETWGVAQDVEGLAQVALGMVEALADSVAVFKPQSAFFERWGSAGAAVLEQCVAAIHEAGGLVILDVKRGDIGSTMAAYAQAYLADGPLSVDAITVSPYLGFGSLAPAIDLAEASGRGVFVLTRTSNPEGSDIQLGRTVSGDAVAQSLVDQAAARNRESGANAVGLVVGGTHQSLGVELGSYTGAILIPGIGAQGGTISGLRSSFAATSALLLPSVSREVLGAGPDPVRLRAAVDKVLAS